MSTEARACPSCGRPVAAPASPPRGGADPAAAAILATLGLIVLMFVLTPVPVVLLSAIWVGWDSSRIQLTRYRSGIASGPILLFLAVSCLWIVGFPWYVYVAQKIRRGEMPLKG